MPTPKFPVDYNAIRIAIVRVVQEITGTTCIVAEPEMPNVPRPAKPYFTMKFIGPGTKYGSDAWDNVKDSAGEPTSVWRLGGSRKISTDFNCYGNTHEEAYNYMGLLQGSLELESVLGLLRAQGIAFLQHGNIADLSALLNTGYEGRAHMQVDFSVASNIDEDLGTMDEFPIVGGVDTNQKIIQINATFTPDEE